jgi:hypothetical protein
MMEATLGKSEDDSRKHGVRGALRSSKGALQARRDGRDSQDEGNPKRVGNLAQFFSNSPLCRSRVKITRAEGRLRSIDL